MGQSPDNMPYDPSTSVTEQVHASIKSSLHNLRPSDASGSANEAYIDMLILHSPLQTLAQTVEAWAACESYVPHRIRNLGMSNCTLPILQGLASRVDVPPAVVQNRFYISTRFDVPLRAFCRDNDIIYQSFWTLTANPELARSNPVQQLASQANISPAAALYSLVLGLGQTTVLNGTTNKEHMVTDLAAPKQVGRLAEEQPAWWSQILTEFQQLVGDS